LETFDHTIQKMTPKTDFLAMSSEMSKLARTEDVRDSNAKLKEMIKQLSLKIGESLATKNDLNRLETKLIKYSNDTFTTTDTHNKNVVSMQKSVKNIENISK
jgi:hypothetical protein